MFSSCSSTSSYTYFAYTIIFIHNLQHGTGVSVEAVDPVFQTNMLDMLKQTGRAEMVVGWYHSHPGFCCWLSGVDMATQTSFEQLNQRAVAVVVDPVQSVKGKVVIDAFRMIAGQNNIMMMSMPTEPRQTTSNIGFLKKPTIQARIHGLDRHYYSLVIDWRKNELEEQMLMNLHKKDWTAGLLLRKFEDHKKSTEAMLSDMTRLSKVRQYKPIFPDSVTHNLMYLLSLLYHINNNTILTGLQ